MSPWPLYLYFSSLHSCCTLYSYFLNCIWLQLYKTRHTGKTTSHLHPCLLGYSTHVFFSVLIESPKNVLLSLMMRLTSVTPAVRKLRQKARNWGQTWRQRKILSLEKKNANAFLCKLLKMHFLDGLWPSATVSHNDLFPSYITFVRYFVTAIQKVANIHSEIYASLLFWSCYPCFDQFDTRYTASSFTSYVDMDWKCLASQLASLTRSGRLHVSGSCCDFTSDARNPSVDFCVPSKDILASGEPFYPKLIGNLTSSHFIDSLGYGNNREQMFGIS